MTRLQGEVAFINGAARGQGRAQALNAHSGSWPASVKAFDELALVPRGSVCTRR
jgi:hypothetical protein